MENLPKGRTSFVYFLLFKGETKLPFNFCLPSARVCRLSLLPDLSLIRGSRHKKELKQSSVSRSCRNIKLQRFLQQNKVGNLKIRDKGQKLH